MFDKDKFYNIIANLLLVSVKEIKDSSLFVEDLGADSLDMVELLLEFEHTYKIMIDDEVAEKVKTVEDAMNVVIDAMNEDQ